jgi:hypothetical protein
MKREREREGEREGRDRERKRKRGIDRVECTRKVRAGTKPWTNGLSRKYGRALSVPHSVSLRDYYINVPKIFLRII